MTVKFDVIMSRYSGTIMELRSGHYTSVHRKCPTEMSYRNVLQKCPTEMSYRNVLQKCPTEMSYRNVLQKCGVYIQNMCNRQSKNRIQIPPSYYAQMSSTWQLKCGYSIINLCTHMYIKLFIDSQTSL